MEQEPLRPWQNRDKTPSVSSLRAKTDQALEHLRIPPAEATALHTRRPRHLRLSLSRRSSADPRSGRNLCPSQSCLPDGLQRDLMPGRILLARKQPRSKSRDSNLVPKCFKSHLSAASCGMRASKMHLRGDATSISSIFTIPMGPRRLFNAPMLTPAAYLRRAMAGNAWALLRSRARNSRDTALPEIVSGVLALVLPMRSLFSHCRVPRTGIWSVCGHRPFDVRITALKTEVRTARAWPRRRWREIARNR